MDRKEKSRKELLQEIKSLKAIINKQQKMLDDPDQRCKTALDEAADAIVLVNLKGNIVAVNKSCSKLLGFKKAQFTGEKLKKFLDPSDQKKFSSLISSLEDGKTILQEFIFINSKGKQIYSEVSFKKISDNEFVGIVRDVTERKQIQRQLHENQVKTRILFEQVPTVVWTTDEKLRVKTYSSNGRPVKKLSGQELKALYPGKPITYEPIAGHYKALKGIPAKVIHSDQDRIFESVLEPIKDHHSNIIGVVGCSFDITSKITQQKELESSQQLFKTISENSEDVIFKLIISGKEVKYEYISPSVSKLSGYLAEEFYQDPTLSYQMVVDEDKTGLFNFPKGKPFSCISRKIENRIITKQGNIVFVETINNIFYDKNSKPSMVIGITRNVTDRMEAEKARLLSEDRYRKMAEATAEGIILHEEGIVKDVNTAFCKMLGYREEELIGKSALFLVNDEFHNVIKDAIASEKSEPYEVIGKTKSGKNFYAELTPRTLLHNGRKLRIVAVRDITLKKIQEAAIAESEEQYRFLFNKSPLPMIVYNKGEFAITNVNDAAVELYGYSRKEFLKLSLLDIRPEIEHEKFSEQYRKNSQNDELIYKGHWIHRKKDGTSFEVEVTRGSFLVTGIHYNISIIKDISERIQQQKRLKDSEERFRMLAENALDIVYRYQVNPEHKYEYVSPSVYELTGYTPEDFYNDPYLGFKLVHEDDRPKTASSESVLKKGKTVHRLRDNTTILRWVTKSGEIIWTETRNTPVYDKDGNVRYIEGISRNISERIKLQEELIESRETYKSLLESIPAGVLIIDGEQIIYANPSAFRVFGYDQSPQELSNISIYEHILPEYHSRINVANEKVRRGEKFPFLEIKAKKADGSVVDIETRSVLVKYKGTDCIQVIFHDITYRKRIEQERKAYETEIDLSRKTYKELIESSPDAIMIFRDEKIIFVNPQVKRIFEVEDDSQIIGTNVMMLLPPHLRSFGFERKQAAERGESLNFVEILLESFKGTPRSLETKSIKVQYQGEPAIMIVMHDLSERKQLIREKMRAQVAEETNSRLQEEIERHRRTQKKLELNQQYTRSIIESSLDMIIAADINGNVTEFNKAAQTTFGYSFEEIVGKRFSILYADDSEEKRILESINLTGHFKGEVLNRKKNGEIFVSYLSASAHLAENGQQIGNMGVSRDITKIKLAEEALKLSEEKYRAIYNHVFVGIAMVALSGQFIQVNKQLCNMFGYSEEELLSLNFADITHPDDVEISNQFKKELISGAQKNFALEKRYINKKGELVYAMLTSTLVSNEHGVPDYFLSVFQDITSQRKVEEQVRIQASKLNAIFESSSHVIWTIDKTSSLTSCNRNFHSLFRSIYGFDAYAGMKVNASRLLAGQEHTTAWIKRYEDAFLGISQHFESSLTDPETGKLIWREIFLNPIFDANNEVVEVSGIGHDITEKKLSEERIKLSLREKEVLLKEVHHRVKNNLQVISSILNLQSSYVKDKNTLEMLRESQDRIKSMSFIHESLYAAKDFSKVNFAEYITNLSKNLLHSYRVYGNQVSLDIKADTVFMNLDYAIPSGLIINELVSNAFKYAFPNDRSGSVKINMRESGNTIYIIIEDNGVGLPANIDYRNTESLGLQLVCTLVDQLNGQISLDNENGTKYTIWFNKDQKII